MAPTGFCPKCSNSSAGILMDEIEELKIGSILVIAKKCPNCGYIEFYDKSKR